MPWKVGTMSELRLNFVHEVVHLKKTIVQSCRKYGISRKTGYKWLTVYRKDASSALIDRSRRPVRSPLRSEAKIEAEVLSVRDQFGWGAPKIWAYLRNRNEGLEKSESALSVPSERTIGNILRRHGRIESEKAPESVPPTLFERSKPHELWQCDFKGPLEVERRRVHPFTVLDDHSRFLMALRVCVNVQMGTAWEVLWETFGEYGLPEKLLCDGAFAASHAGIPTVSWIEARLIRLGICPVHGRAYHPQTQGKVERLHGTLEREVWPRVDRGDAARFAEEIEKWRREVYNPVRPHESLDGRPPLSRFGPSPRAHRAHLPEVSYPSGSVERRVATLVGGVIGFWWGPDCIRKSSESRNASTRWRCIFAGSESAACRTSNCGRGRCCSGRPPSRGIRIYPCHPCPFQTVTHVVARNNRAAGVLVLRDRFTHSFTGRAATHDQPPERQLTVCLGG
jgi:transposase